MLILLEELKTKDPELYTILVNVIDELYRANKKFPLFGSAHEGYAIIKEEVDELWDEIKNKDGTKAHMRLEAKQVAATALKFIISTKNW